MRLVIGEPYRSDVSPEYAIRGNSVLFKCSIPPFVADFVSVVTWIDDAGNSYYNINENGVTNYGTQNVVFFFKFFKTETVICRLCMSHFNPSDLAVFSFKKF